MIFNKIIIIGLGLIGGSAAIAIKKYKIAKKILAYNRSSDAINFALENNIIDDKFHFDQNLTKDDLIIIATPLLAYEEIFQKIKSQNYQSLITDIGSVKKYPEDLYFKIFKERNNFIPAHPIAGKETSSIFNADANLFCNKKLIITNFCQNQENITKIKQLWQKIGSEVVFLDSLEHDEIFCLISHLPQYISFKFREKRPDNLPDFLKRHLRIENSNPKIWEEIFELNRDNIDRYYRIFKENYKGLELEDVATPTKIKDFDSPLVGVTDGAQIITPPKGESKLQSNFGGGLTPLTQESKQSKIALVGADITNHTHLIQKRLIIIKAYLKIKELKKAKNFAGTGFNDFVSIKNLH
jgi:prephenate dehydrogenase